MLRLLPLMAALSFTGCGHSDEEMNAKQAEINALKGKLAQSDKERTDLANNLQKANSDIAALRTKLGDYAGAEVETNKLRAALAEYEAKLKQLDAMKKRLSDLKARLEKLTAVGLKVEVRNNRMVIQLPGDVLFDSGLDTLKGDGKKILKQVADAVRSDETLKTRHFQVAGHTDNVEYGGPYRDNWGLALMRARQVVLFLTTPQEPKPGQPKPPGDVPFGGGLEPKNWAAAGYGIYDPVAGTVEQQSKEDKAKNRRVELVLQPNVEEMLNLKDL
jgi:chemotaxis protein MotB